MNSLKEENELIKKENNFLKKENSLLKEKLEKSKTNENLYQTSLKKMKLLQQKYETTYSKLIEEKSKKEDNNKINFQSKFNQIENKTIESENKYKELINELTTTNKNLTTKIYQLQRIITFKDKKILDLKNEINKIIKQATSEIKQLNNQLTKFEVCLHASNSHKDKKVETKSRTIINKNIFLDKKNNITNLSNSIGHRQSLSNKDTSNSLQDKGLQHSYRIKNIKYHAKNTITPKTHGNTSINNEIIKHFDDINLNKKNNTYLISNIKEKNIINKNKTLDPTNYEISGVTNDPNIKIKNISYLKEKTSYSDHRNQVIKSSSKIFNYSYNNNSFNDENLKIENGNTKMSGLGNNLVDYGVKTENLKNNYQNSLKAYKLDANMLKNNYVNTLNENNNLKKFYKDNLTSGNINEKKNNYIDNNKIMEKDFNKRLKSQQHLRKNDTMDRFMAKKIIFPNEEVDRNEYVNSELQKINEQEKNNDQSLTSKDI